MAPRLAVFTHGHCFDGLASAVTFAAFHQALRGPSERSFVACDYGPKTGPIAPARLGDGDSAILDFRYTAADRLGWYFDHHATAFTTPDDRAHFERGPADRRFYDAGYGSCTELVRDVARDRFAIELPALAELVAWAAIIDAAKFPTAEAAMSRVEPAMRLMMTVEHDGDDRFLTQLVPLLETRSLAEVAAMPLVADRVAVLGPRREATLEKIRAALTVRGDVALCDLSAGVLDVIEKFAVYAYAPETRYALVLSRSPNRLKISLGSNPWCARPRTHDLGAICKRHGGGGHPYVGAFALPEGRLDEARAAVDAIAEELAG